MFVVPSAIACVLLGRVFVSIILRGIFICIVFAGVFVSIVLTCVFLIGISSIIAQSVGASLVLVFFKTIVISGVLVGIFTS